MHTGLLANKQPFVDANEVSRPTDALEYADCSKLQILVVDDNDVLLLAATGLLATWDILPTLASDGEEAVRLATRKDFDLIFMDLQMPKMDGLEAARQIRLQEQARQQGKNVPIVAYTSGEFEYNAKLRHAGFNALLQKPSDPRSIAACLRYWCQGRLAAVST